MNKKFVVIILILALCCSLFLFTGCEEKEQKLILYLGDSIAESIAGMSPISERENYGYYALVGRRNDYIYRNRAVSGHMSKDLLALIQEEDTDGRMLQTYLKTADIIHISILGNDFLLNSYGSLGQMIVQAANDDFSIVNQIIEESEQNFADIVSIIKSFNSDAVLMFQTVYNPVFEYSTLINSYARATLANMEVDESEYRALADVLVNKLNDITRNYLGENPDSFYIIDAYDEFDKIYEDNNDRGKNLIFSDDIHPTNEGHAVMADLIQEKLEELDLAKKESAIKKYKVIKIEQLERLYADCIDIESVKRQIKKADSCSEITQIYFEATNGFVPDYC